MSDHGEDFGAEDMDMDDELQLAIMMSMQQVSRAWLARRFLPCIGVFTD